MRLSDMLIMGMGLNNQPRLKAARGRGNQSDWAPGRSREKPRMLRRFKDRRPTVIRPNTIFPDPIDPLRMVDARAKKQRDKKNARIKVSYRSGRVYCRRMMGAWA